MMLDSVSGFFPAEYRLASVQAPMKAPGGGWMWYHMTMEGPVPSTFVDALWRLESTLDPERGPIPRDAPLFLVGFSQGGTIALSFATLRFGWVKGVASLSGMLFDDRSLPGPLGVLKGKPVLIIHGRHDTVRAIGHAREATRRLKAVGADVTFLEHDGAHVAPPEIWAQVVEWVRAANRR